MVEQFLKGTKPLIPKKFAIIKMMMTEPLGEPIREVKKDRFDPYEMHGGTAAAICGPNFVVLGSDTRLSSDYSIDCRHKSRIFKMSKTCVLCITGFDADIDAFVTQMNFIMSQYEYQHFHPMPIESVARCVANELYRKRFFPYYINTLVAGINSKGEGKLYGYDPVGTIEDLKYDTNGTGSAYAGPLLDSIFGTVHRNTIPFPEVSIDDAKNTIKDAISSVAERDIYTGDYLELATITADDFTIETMDLPKH